MFPDRTAVAARLVDSDASGAWTQRWFELYPRPCLLLGRKLQVLGINTAGQAMLERENTIHVREGCLGARDRKAHLVLEEAVRLCPLGEPARRIHFGDTSTFVLRFVALGPGQTDPVALTLRSTEQEDMTCADLGQPFGLTQGEQRIVERLLRGCSSQEIAEAMGKSVLTIRTHIKRAYIKLSVTTREQLFARLLPFLDT